MTIFEQAQELVVRLGITYPPDLSARDTARFVGYWLRVAGEPRPDDAPVATGWDDADAEAADWRDA